MTSRTGEPWSGLKGSPFIVVARNARPARLVEAEDPARPGGRPGSSTACSSNPVTSTRVAPWGRARWRTARAVYRSRAALMNPKRAPARVAGVFEEMDPSRPCLAIQVGDSQVLRLRRARRLDRPGARGRQLFGCSGADEELFAAGLSRFSGVGAARSSARRCPSPAPTLVPTGYGPSSTKGTVPTIRSLARAAEPWARTASAAGGKQRIPSPRFQKERRGPFKCRDASIAIRGIPGLARPAPRFRGPLSQLRRDSAQPRSCAG